jgi:hypothetical protein
MNQIVTTNETPPATDPASVASFISIIAEAARDTQVDVTKMEALLNLQERMMAKQAQIDFDVAFISMQAELPRITKDSSIKHNDRMIAKYAKYESIDEIIRPILIKHGFGLRYNTEPTGNQIIVTATLSHKGGHSITDKIPLGIDASGAKNNVQGVGSTIAYGKRYLVGMLLNLVFEGEDDDGTKSGYVKISDERAAEIKDLLLETGSDVKGFLKYIGAASVDEMNAKDFDRAVTTIKNAAEARRKKELTAGGAQ